MKLIIDIPEEDYEFTKSAKTARYFSSAYYVELILNGIPLDDVKAEIHKANCYYHGTEYGEGIDLCENILDKYIGKAGSEDT